jgi:hypothetical protein
VPRDEVQHASQRAPAVERRRGSLHDLDLRQVERRYLKQAEPVGRLAKDREAIEQDLRVAAGEPLEPESGRAEGRGRRLDLHARQLGEEGRNVPRRDRRVLFDLLPGDGLDAHRLVLDDRVAARREDRRDLLRRLRALELDDEDRGLLLPQGRRALRGHEAVPLDADLLLTVRKVEGRVAALVGQRRNGPDAHLGVRDRCRAVACAYREHPGQDRRCQHRKSMRGLSEPAVNAFPEVRVR